MVCAFQVHPQTTRSKASDRLNNLNDLKTINNANLSIFGAKIEELRRKRGRLPKETD